MNENKTVVVPVEPTTQIVSAMKAQLQMKTTDAYRIYFAAISAAPAATADARLCLAQQDGADRVITLTPKQCAEQFRMYAQSHGNPDCQHQLRFCADFLDEYCVLTAPQDAWVDVMKRLPERGQRIQGLSRSGAWIEGFDPDEPLGHMTHWRAVVEEADQPELTCKSCGADRTKEDCKGDRANCSLRGTAYVAEGKAEQQVESVERKSLLDILGRYYREELQEDTAIELIEALYSSDSAQRPECIKQFNAYCTCGKAALCNGKGHPPTQPQGLIKDHVIAQTINQLRDIAIEFHATQQLRARIAEVIVPLLSRQSSKGTE